MCFVRWLHVTLQPSDLRPAFLSPEQGEKGKVTDGLPFRVGQRGAFAIVPAGIRSAPVF